MSLPVLSNWQKEQWLTVVIAVMVLLLVATVCYVVVIGGLDFNPALFLELDPGVDGHCTVTSCTAVGT